MPRMSPMSDLVKDARLATKTDSEYTIHTFLESTSAEGRRARRREREEFWEKKQHLGIGICGTVWLEECVANGDSKLRVVKEVRKIAPAPRPMDFSRELEAITKFSQQRFDGCFVRSSGWFENTDSVFICMEYLPHGDLQRYMVRPFAEDEAQQITLQLLEGLDFMHTHGFAHRDLKPQHVFVLSTGPNWWVKIGDFGISKCVTEALTGVQTLNGTPAFIAPEVYQQIWGPDKEKKSASEEQFTPEVDIWSLGVITYYMITGKLPFLAKNDLLAYYNGEASLPVEALDQHQATLEASTFLEQTLAPTPVKRISARDALEHPWLVPLLESSESDDTEQRDSIIGQAIGSPLRIETSRPTSDVMLPGTIDLSPLPITPATTDLSFPVSPTRLGIPDSYQQMINTGHPGFLNRFDHSGSDSASTTRSQYNGSQNSEPTLRMNHSRQISSLNTSSLDSLQPYVRRELVDAPIPVSDLDLHHSTTGTSSGNSGSTGRHHTSRFSERLRHFSSGLVQKRSGRFQGQGTIHQKRDKELPKDKEQIRSVVDLPNSPLSSNSSTETQFRSHVVDITRRSPQYADNLPMFPVHS